MRTWVDILTTQCTSRPAPPRCPDISASVSACIQHTLKWLASTYETLCSGSKDGCHCGPWTLQRPTNTQTAGLVQALHLSAILSSQMKQRPWRQCSMCTDIKLDVSICNNNNNVCNATAVAFATPATMGTRRNLNAVKYEQCH